MFWSNIVLVKVHLRGLDQGIGVGGAEWPGRWTATRHRREARAGDRARARDKTRARDKDRARAKAGDRDKNIS